MGELTATAGLDWAQLSDSIGIFLGWGRVTNWSAEQILRVDEYVQSGLRQFYTPPVLPGARMSHDWRFLRPTTSIVGFADLAVASAVTVSSSDTTLTATGGTPFVDSMIGKTITITSDGDVVIQSVTSSTVVVLTTTPNPVVSSKTFSISSNGDYQLPTDFGSMMGHLTYAPDAGYLQVHIHSEGEVRRLRQTASAITGRPTMAAIRPKAVDATAEQLYELMLYPEPGSNYTLSYQYRVLVNKLTTTNKFPLGGQVHSETIKASCLAVAEQAEDDTRGIHWQQFMERLAASISYDSRTSAEYIGHPSNRCGQKTPWRVHFANSGSVTYVP